MFSMSLHPNAGFIWEREVADHVGTKGVSQNHLLSFDDNKVLKIINWIC